MKWSWYLNGAKVISFTEGNCCTYSKSCCKLSRCLLQSTISFKRGKFVKHWIIVWPCGGCLVIINKFISVNNSRTLYNRSHLRYSGPKSHTLKWVSFGLFSKSSLHISSVKLSIRSSHLILTFVRFGKLNNSLLTIFLLNEKSCNLSQ